MSYFALRMEEKLGGVAEHTDTALAGQRLSDDWFFFPADEAQLTSPPTHFDRSAENRGITASPPHLIDGYEPAGSINTNAYPHLFPPLLMLAGHVGAVDEGNGTNDVKTLTITGSPTGGSIDLTMPVNAGGETIRVPYNATPQQVQDAIDGLRAFRPDGADCAVTGTALPAGSIVLTFRGRYSCMVVGSVTVDDDDLTGGTTPTAAVANTTPGTTGTVLDPDGNGLPAGAHRWVFTKRLGPLAKTAEIIASYEEHGVVLCGNGYGVSQFGITQAGKVTAELMGIYTRRIPDPALAKAYPTLAMRPLRRGDLSLTWLGGGAEADEFSAQIANTLERGDYLTDKPSYYSKALEHTGVFPELTGTINKRSLSPVDWDAIHDARTFAGRARWISESSIGATGKPYGLWYEAPSLQHLNGDPAAISNNRRFGQQINWRAAYDESAGYDYRITVVCGLATAETYTP